MIIELIEYIGMLKNDTNTPAHAYIFSVLNNEMNNTIECILYVHETITPFITLHDNNNEELKSEILEAIFKKYTLKQLLNL